MWTYVGAVLHAVLTPAATVRVFNADRRAWRSWTRCALWTLDIASGVPPEPLTRHARQNDGPRFTQDRLPKLPSDLYQGTPCSALLLDLADQPTAVTPGTEVETPGQTSPPDTPSSNSNDQDQL